MFLLEYDLVTDYPERRSEFREDHLALATEETQRGELVLWRIQRTGPFWSGGCRSRGRRRVRPSRSLRDQRLGALVFNPTVDRWDRHGRLPLGMITGRQKTGRSSAL